MWEVTFAIQGEHNYKLSEFNHIHIEKWFPTWGEFPTRGEFRRYRREFEILKIHKF